MDVSIISLVGEFDLSEQTRLEDVFATAESAAAVIVDFTKAQYIDSTILAGLIQLRRATLERKARFMLAGLGPPFNRLFQVTGVSVLFETAPTLADAVGAFGSDDVTTEHFVLSGTEP
jgi:anti-sigma B factor antagonist